MIRTLLRLGLWLFFLCAVIYCSRIIPQAAMRLINGGIHQPKFWRDLFLILILSFGTIGLGVAVIWWAKAEIVAFRNGKETDSSNPPPDQPK